MQKWPKLRSITVHYVDQRRRPTFDASQAADCCPDLREVIFKGFVLFRDELKVLCTLCSGVTRLEVPGLGHIGESLDALCDCLRAWSSTLEYLSLRIHLPNLPLYQPLSQVLSMLNGLRELVLLDMRLDVDAISELPRLERLSCSPHIDNDGLMSLSRRLRDTNKLPSLKSISMAAYSFSNNADGRKELKESCIVRKIHF